MRDFKVGDKVWAKSCSGRGTLHWEGYGVVSNILRNIIDVENDRGYHHNIVVNDKHYKHDEIRHLTKLDKILS